MREILFRGKLKSNGEWSFGNLNVSLRGTVIITPDETPIGKYGQVIPETVGQYTGLTDKNGKKIFEGDIVRFYDKDWTANGIATVDFEKGRWKINGHYTTKLSSIVWLDLYRTGFEYEVIGNIYDNPELLEEKL